jgi:hypothetical protein
MNEKGLAGATNQGGAAKMTAPPGPASTDPPQAKPAGSVISSTEEVRRSSATAGKSAETFSGVAAAPSEKRELHDPPIFRTGEFLLSNLPENPS